MDKDGQLNPDAKIIMGDLEKLCCYNASTFQQGSPDYSAYLEGTRSVFLRIRGHLFEKQNYESIGDDND